MTEQKRTHNAEEIKTASIKLSAFSIKYVDAIAEALREEDYTKYATALGYIERMSSEVAKLKWRVSEQLSYED